MGEQQTLVDDRAGRKAGHVELGDGGLLVLLGQIRQRILGLLADGEQFALECVLVLGVRPHRHDGLADERHLVEHGLAQSRRIGGDIAPAEQGLAFDLDEMLELLDDDFARLGFARQEAHRHGIFARLRQFHARGFGPFAQQRVGNLNQDAGAVAHQGVGAHRAAMVEIDQKLEPLADNAVGFLAFDVGDKAHAARVMLMPRIVKSLFWRQTHRQTSEFSYFGHPSPLILPKTSKKTSASLLFAHLLHRD